MSITRFCSVKEALSVVKDGSSIMIGGFGSCGVPLKLIQGISPAVKNLKVIINNPGPTLDTSVGILVKRNQVQKLVSSYVGENKELCDLYAKGKIAIEVIPQGTLAEKIRCGGEGIPAFYTRTGVETDIHFGGIPIRLDEEGNTIEKSSPKLSHVFNDKLYLMEESLNADIALIRAWKADEEGNIVFRGTTRAFSVDMAAATKKTIVEVETIVPTGSIKPEDVHIPAIYVSNVVHVPNPERFTETIVDEQTNLLKLKIAKRAARELVGSKIYVNFGFGLPTLVPKCFTDEQVKSIVVHSESGLLGVGKRDASANPDYVDPGKAIVSVIPGSSISSSADAFGLIRGGHLNFTMLGAIEVDQFGDLANWTINKDHPKHPEIQVPELKGMGGAMDLVSAHDKTKVIVLTSHCNKKGEPKIVKKCHHPITGSKCVDKIITELAVFDVCPEIGLTLVEIAEGVSLEDIKKKTGAPFKISDKVKMNAF